MLDRDLVLDAIEDAQRILAAHIEPGSHRSPETTITMLVCLLDRHEVVAAVKRLRAGYGLRVVKWSRKHKPQKLCRQLRCIESPKLDEVADRRA